MSDESRIIIGPLRLCYVYVDEPQADKPEPGQELRKPQYKCTVLIPKDDSKNIDKIEDAIDAAIDEFIAKGKAKNPKAFERPLLDGDRKKKDDLGIYEDHFYINAKSYDAPGLVNQRGKPMLDRTGFYSGCFAMVSVTFYPYDHPKGGLGVGAALNNLMFFKDGDKIGGVGGIAADEEFKDFVKKGRGEEDEDEPKSRRGGRGREEDEEKPKSRRSRDDEDEEVTLKMITKLLRSKREDGLKKQVRELFEEFDVEDEDELKESKYEKFYKKLQKIDDLPF